MVKLASLRIRLALFTGAAVAICAAIAASAAWLVKSTHAGDTALTQEVSSHLQDSYAALERLVGLQGALQAMLRLKDADEIEQAMARLDVAHRAVATLLARTDRDASDLGSRLDKLTAVSKEVTDRVLLADNSAALELYVTRFNPAMEQLQLGLRAHALRAAKEAADGAVAHEQAVTRKLVVLAGILMVLVGGLATTGWLFQRAMMRTLGRMATRLDAVAGALHGHAASVADGSQAVANGATKQAAALEETGASTTELLSISESAAKTLASAAHEAGLARNDSSAGETEVARLNAAMTELHEAGRSVEKIIKSIDEIAFQTNLLALNAAVEAARAGEAGAGFAVVAEEVRALAQRSAQAARETSERIGYSLSKSSLSSEISIQVGRNLSDIALRARRVDELVKELTGSIHEQNAGIRQISAAMSQIDQVTQANAASAELSASATHEMAGEVQQLNETISELHSLLGVSGEVARSHHAPAHTESVTSGSPATVSA